MLKKIFVYHVPALILACILLCVFYFFLSSNHTPQEPVLKTISGQQAKTRGHHSNLLIGEQAEIDLLTSIKNKNQLTLFGSSEFSTSPYCTYHFLPDSMGRQIMGIGHAYHQHLSILIELLAANEYVDSSDICIFLSPGWFSGKETNPQAFIEFARPNFLTKIANDSTIDDIYLDAIGEYINRHENDFESLSNVMSYLKNRYLKRHANPFKKFELFIDDKMKTVYDQKYAIDQVKYEVTLADNSVPKQWDGDMAGIGKAVQDTFVSGVKSNDIYVDDFYFETYLKREDGSFEQGELPLVDIPNNHEYKDFKLVVRYLKSKGVNISFIIIPLNPHFYFNTDVHLPLIDSVTAVLEKNDIPYYNLYAGSVEEYEPGILKDVMHFGDYGWMHVNQYIDSLYYGRP